MTLPPLTLALASQSPARLATLRAAGIEPLTQVSQVDEEALVRQVRGAATQKVLALAAAKARDVAAGPTSAAGADLIIGCDSMFEFGGEVVGKPHSAEVARERLRAMAGHAGVLHTGHYLIHRGSLRSLGAVSHATVHVAPMTDAEIDAYIATGEPLEVAGSFTVDGLGGAFIERIDGDYHGVVGLSLPLLRAMLTECGLSITQLWTGATMAEGEVSQEGLRFLDDTHVMRLHHGADGFLLCSCGSRHWGLNGAAGICAFRRREGRTEVLLQLRAAWSHAGGTWGIPGGAVDWHETTEEGALREFEEETRIGSRHLRPMGTHVATHGDWAYTTIIAACDAAAVAVPDQESERLEWFDSEGPLPENLLPSFAEAWPSIRAQVIAAQASL